jgi:hypothetical protein
MSNYLSPGEGDHPNLPQQPVPTVQPQPVPATLHHANPARQFEHEHGKVKQSRDKAQYVRQQKGHSLTWNLILGFPILWLNVLYYSLSPNHYWHA